MIPPLGIENPSGLHLAGLAILARLPSNGGRAKMPRQELVFEKEIGDRRIEVIKTYDQAFARDAFEDMDEAAQAHLWQSLGIDESYESEELPPQPDRRDFLWEEAWDAAREDGSLLSFFVVTEAIGRRVENLYVSPDWPSAEAFAMAR